MQEQQQQQQKQTLQMWRRKRSSHHPRHAYAGGGGGVSRSPVQTFMVLAFAAGFCLAYMQATFLSSAIEKAVNDAQTPCPGLLKLGDAPSSSSSSYRSRRQQQKQRQKINHDHDYKDPSSSDIFQLLQTSSNGGGSSISSAFISFVMNLLGITSSSSSSIPSSTSVDSSSNEDYYYYETTSEDYTNYTNSTPAPTYNWLMQSDHFPACTKLEPDQVDYTLVTQGSDERLWLMEQVCQRWKGPISIALYTSSSHAQIMKLLVDRMGCSRERIALSIVSTDDYPPHLFPFNVLRNKAIEAAKTTTHFVLLDMDFVPNADLEELLHSPDVLHKLTKDTKAAIVIPAFDMFKPSECYEFPNHCRNLGCHAVKDTPKDVCSREANPIPRNMTELLLSDSTSERVRPCNFFDVHGNKNFPKGQASTDYSQWYMTEPGKIYKVPCVQPLDYEPYIAVRRCQLLPPFQDDFLGYGRDKSSWFVQLRLMDYEFWPLGGAFCVHYPHSRGLDTMHVHSVNLIQKRNHMFDDLGATLEDDPNIHSRSPVCTDDDIDKLIQDLIPRPTSKVTTTSPPSVIIEPDRHPHQEGNNDHNHTAEKAYSVDGTSNGLLEGVLKISTESLDAGAQKMNQTVIIS